MGIATQVCRHRPSRAGTGNRVKTGQRIRRETSSRAAVKGSGRLERHSAKGRVAVLGTPERQERTVPWPVTEGDQEPGGAQGAVADGRRVQDGPRARAGSMAPRLSTETRLRQLAKGPAARHR